MSVVFINIITNK